MTLGISETMSSLRSRSVRRICSERGPFETPEDNVSGTIQGQDARASFLEWHGHALASCVRRLVSQGEAGVEKGNRTPDFAESLSLIAFHKWRPISSHSQHTLSLTMLHSSPRLQEDWSRLKHPDRFSDIGNMCRHGSAMPSQHRKDFCEGFRGCNQRYVLLCRTPLPPPALNFAGVKKRDSSVGP